MKKISLTRGQFALVDDEDYGWLMQWNWHANLTPWGFCATRARKRSDGPGMRCILMHREIMGTPEGMQVDHINHDSLDNRKQNLRNCTASENQHNMSLQRGSSKYKGVNWCRQRSKWQARITFERERIWLGLFDSEEEAARAYDEAAQELFGEFAYLNFSREEVLV